MITVLLILSRHKSHNEPVSCVFPHNCNSILQPPDQGTIRSFKHEYCKQHLTKIISMIDHQQLHDETLMEINVSDAPHFLAESWCCDTHTRMRAPPTHTHTHPPASTCPCPQACSHAHKYKLRVHIYDGHELFSEKSHTRTRARARAHAHAHTRTHAHSLSLSLSRARARARTHTHTHTHTHTYDNHEPLSKKWTEFKLD